MKVILFGGAGYIGTHVALSFLERGDEVGIYDNLSTGLESNVSPDAKFYLGDILDRGQGIFLDVRFREGAGGHDLRD